MQAPVAKIQQGDRDLGWGRVGSVNPGGETGVEITLHDVHMLADIEFTPGGPFRLEVESDRYDRCSPTNYRNLRPGCDYDRVIFQTATRPKLG